MKTVSPSSKNLSSVTSLSPTATLPLLESYLDSLVIQRTTVLVLGVVVRFLRLINCPGTALQVSYFSQFRAVHSDFERLCFEERIRDAQT